MGDPILVEAAKPVVDDSRYKFWDINKDSEGDFVGVIAFKYNNDTYHHEFTFVTKEEKLISVDYGFKIPYIDEVWDALERHLIDHSKKSALPINKMSSPFS